MHLGACQVVANAQGGPVLPLPSPLVGSSTGSPRFLSPCGAVLLLACLYSTPVYDTVSSTLRKNPIVLSVAIASASRPPARGYVPAVVRPKGSDSGLAGATGNRNGSARVREAKSKTAVLAPEGSRKPGPGIRHTRNRATGVSASNLVLRGQCLAPQCCQ